MNHICLPLHWWTWQSVEQMRRSCNQSRNELMDVCLLEISGVWSAALHSFHAEAVLSGDTEELDWFFTVQRVPQTHLSHPQPLRYLACCISQRRTAFITFTHRSRTTPTNSSMFQFQRGQTEAFVHLLLNRFLEKKAALWRSCLYSSHDVPPVGSNIRYDLGVCVSHLMCHTLFSPECLPLGSGPNVSAALWSDHLSGPASRGRPTGPAGHVRIRQGVGFTLLGRR